jgi:hypothetical protein
MMATRGSRTTPRQGFIVALVVVASPLLLVACGREVETKNEALPPRPIRITTVAKRDTLTPLTLSRRIEAEDEVRLAGSGFPDVSWRTTARLATGSRPSSCSRNWSPRTS